MFLVRGKGEEGGIVIGANEVGWLNVFFPCSLGNAYKTRRGKTFPRRLRVGA